MRARRGITFFEAVAALAIVGVTSISALAAVGAEMKTAERARRALEVEALATQRLEYLAIVRDADLQNLPDSIAKGQFDKPLDEYKWTTTASARTDPGGVYDVVVTVTWPEGSYALHSAVYRRPRNATRGR